MTDNKYNCDILMQTMFEGCALLQIMKNSDNEVSKCADKAMYQIKRAGGGSFGFY